MFYSSVETGHLLRSERMSLTRSERRGIEKSEKRGGRSEEMRSTMQRSRTESSNGVESMKLNLFLHKATSMLVQWHLGGRG